MPKKRRSPFARRRRAAPRTYHQPRRRRRAAGAGALVAGITPMTMLLGGAGAGVLMGSDWYQGMASDPKSLVGKVRAAAGNGPLVAAIGLIMSKANVGRRYGNALVALGVGMTAVRFVGQKMGAEAAQLGAGNPEELSLEGLDEMGADDDLGADDEA
jgi:hypothetical protein